MRRWVCGALILTLTALSMAQTLPRISPDARTQLRNDESNPLPAYLTPAERLLPMPTPPAGPRSAPTGQVYCPAEYEQAEGLLIRWGDYNNILTPMVVSVTTLDPTAIMYIVVSGASQQSSATTTLTNAGADMSQVQFITAATDTVWIRDYGPRFIFEDGVRAIVDHTYNRPRPNDNLIPGVIGALWGETVYDIGLTHGGGNFHLFSNGEGFMSSLIKDENPSLTEAQIKQRYVDYQNLDVTIYTRFPSSFDSTGHIDMWMLPLADHMVIIGQYASSTGQPYTITEGAVTDLTSRGYTVYRTPGWNSGGTHYTYTNGVVLNNLVLVTKFNVTQDAQAKTVFETALPGHQIIQVDCSSIIGSAGAMHCIVMHVPAYAPQPEPVVSVIAPNGGESCAVGQSFNIHWSATDDVAVTSVDISLSTDGGTTFPHSVATGLVNSGTYPWTVPALVSDQCRIKVVAHDGDGNTGADMSNANFSISPFGPQVVYDYPLDANPGWTVQGQWAFGHPTGGGGAHGYTDPSNGATGTNVFGVNLSGDYSTTVGGPYYLTAGPLNLSAYSSVKLRFQRWLNSDYQPYAYATLAVSNNGSSWTSVWSNGTAEITENAWSLPEYDISATADHQATVYVRWGYQVGSGAWAYSGWNIDDVQFIGVPSFVTGDMNCDGVIDNFDINPFVLALTSPAAYAAQYPNCSYILADINGDGIVDNFDINPFVDLLTGP